MSKMKLKTHVSTGLVLAYMFDFYMLSLFPSYSSNILLRFTVYVLSPLLQVLMDGVGHEVSSYHGKSYIARTPRTHSLLGIAGLTLAIGLPLALITQIEYMIYFVLSQLLLHWLEDLPTEGGVYLLFHRVRLGSISYNNIVLNRMTILLIFAVGVLYTNPFRDITTLIFFLIVLTVSSYAFLD